MYINSPGGSFTALTAIYDTMQYVKPDIQTVCLGQAASAAAVLLAAGTQASGWHCQRARPDPPAGAGRRRRPGLRHRDPGQRGAAHAHWLEEMLARHSNRTAEQVRNDIERDKILTAEQAVEYGLVDQVLGSRKPACRRTAGLTRPRPVRPPPTRVRRPASPRRPPDTPDPRPITADRAAGRGTG